MSASPAEGNTDIAKNGSLHNKQKHLPNSDSVDTASRRRSSPPPEQEYPNSRRVNLDSILEETGQLGPFQWRLLGVCSVVAMLAAWPSLEYLFTTTRISTRCLIQECESSNPEWRPEWVYSAIPASGSGALDNCQRFAPARALAPNGSILPSGAAPGACPADLFDRSTVQACEEYVYENTNSIVYDYNLGCDEWRRTLIGSVRTVGLLLGLPLSGYISDRWGRRVALTVYTVNCAWLGVTRYWANTYIGFMISQLVESILGSGIFTSAYILTLEFMGIKYRTAAAAALTSAFAVGQMTLGLIAWSVPYWKNLTLSVYIPQFLGISYYWLVPESARWYLSKGRYEESEAIIKKIARTNGKTLNVNSLKRLKETADEERKKRELEIEEKKNEPWLIVTVFRHNRVLLRCIVAPVWWITYTFVYYGLSVNAVNMVGNRYLNYVAVSLVEIPASWTAAFLLGKIGRKSVLTSAFWICAACQLAYIFIPSDYYSISLTVYLLGKYAITVVTIAIYVYTAELYPTKHRHTLFAFTSMVGRIGAITAPLTPAIAKATFANFPFVLFGLFALVSGALTFLTPETLGTKLPDTMEEAHNLTNT